jgi:hypothetical protein
LRPKEKQIMALPLRRVAAAEAEDHPLYGLGGWLLLIYLGSLLRAVELLVGLIMPMPEIHAAGDPVAMQIRDATLLFLALPFLVLAPLKHPMMPLITIACVWTAFGVTLAFSGIGLAGSGSGGGAGLAALMLFAFDGPGPVEAAVLTWYFLRSRRINVTYRHLVPDTRLR